MMLAVMFIIGQLNVPLQQIVAFVRAAQDAKLSLERLGEVRGQEVRGEEREVRSVPSSPLTLPSSPLVLENLSFRYNPLSEWVLKNVNLEIPAGKVTAIVGTSGSGKTTLVKLLLGFYEPEEGSIGIRFLSGMTSLKHISPHEWRSRCGAVMQDGFILSDTIASNIAESDPDGVDKERLMKAVQVAHGQEFIESLPLGYNTMVGAQGNGLSQGQRQRLLIARAVYKDPEFLFFDEATNALDAHNEKIILENLHHFFQGRTVVIVAHRLSTVKNADRIVVLEKGEIAEFGTHEELTGKRGKYFHLIKEQLGLGA
jgi:ATP-binding cassette subfamily B protein